VAAGEKVQFSRETSRALPPVQRAAPEEIRATLAWQNPLTTFTDVPLREVVIQFNRRNVRQLLIDDATLGERRIGGVIALDQVEAFVRLLEQDGDVVSEPRGENAIALRRAR
jgi:transmembrane sensor